MAWIEVLIQNDIQSETLWYDSETWPSRVEISESVILLGSKANFWYMGWYYWNVLLLPQCSHNLAPSEYYA